MLPIKKLYIDSRYKSGDSVSDSNFKIDLPQNLLMPAGTGFYIDDVSIPVSWYTIDTGRNDTIYFRLNGVYTTSAILPGNYSLVNLNEAIVKTMNESFNGRFESSPNVRENKVGIKCITNESFEILTDAQLKALGLQVTNSVNNVLRNFTSQVNNASNSFFGYQVM